MIVCPRRFYSTKPLIMEGLCYPRITAATLAVAGMARQFRFDDARHVLAVIVRHHQAEGPEG